VQSGISLRFAGTYRHHLQDQRVVCCHACCWLLVLQFDLEDEILRGYTHTFRKTVGSPPLGHRFFHLTWWDDVGVGHYVTRVPTVHSAQWCSMRSQQTSLHWTIQTGSVTYRTNGWSYTSPPLVGYGLEGRGGRSSTPGRGNIIFPLHVMQTGSEANPASYPLGTVGCFLVVKAAGPWSWPLTSN
jgi:hypothetical protein